MKNREKLSAVLTIFCLGIIVYSNTFYCSFHYDDDIYIVNNYVLRNLHHLQNIWNFEPSRFILYLSFALDYHFHQLNVFGYHIINLAIHLVSAILVWWFALLTFSTPAMKEGKIARHANVISLLAGAVFVTHPVQTEAVTYIVQRSASMAAMFYLASLSLYVKSSLLYDQKPSLDYWKPYYISALITAVLAMFTKETAITLPLIVLLYEFTFLNTKRSINWKFIAPFLLIIFTIPLTMVFFNSTRSINHQEMQHAIAGTSEISTIHYLLTQFRVIVTYIRLLFLPFNQNLDYDYPVFSNILEAPVLISLLFLLTILFCAKRLFLKHRIISFSIFWFFLTLLPESSLFPIKDVIFEHRLYLPLAGYSIFLASGVYYLWGKNNLKMMVIILSAFVAFYAALTFQRNKVWTDDMTLWGDALAKSPHKARAFLNLGIYDGKQGNLDQAAADFNKVISIDPTHFPEAYTDLGVIDERYGKISEAILEYNKAIAIDPKFGMAYYNRGLIYNRIGHFSQAIADFTKIIENDPINAKVYTIRGQMYGELGNYVQSISDFNKSIEIDPDYIEGYLNLGITYGKQGNLTQAIIEFNKVLEINPNDRRAYDNRAICLHQASER